jgi:hypothetical protein
MDFSLSDFQKADPSSDPEAARLTQLLMRLEGRLQGVFQTFVREASSDALMSSVSDHLERGDVDGALDLIQPLIAEMGAEVPLLYQAAGLEEAKHLDTQLPDSIGLHFDVGNRRASELMRTAQLEFVQGFTDQQRAAVRLAMSQGFAAGDRNYEAMARRFRSAIGLSAQQEAWAQSYERLLRAGSTLALDRDLRDRRFDPSVRAAAEGRRQLTEPQIERMMTRYRERLQAFRAVTIARTEGVRIMSEAQQMALTQVMEDTELDSGDVRQTWHTNMDGRERLTHGLMNGQRRALGVPFDSPGGAQLRYPGDPAAPADEVCNCRCYRSFNILRGASGRAAA